MNRIFFSWQMNTSPKVNRYLLRDALLAAAGGLARPAEIDEATRGVAGSPGIFETILAKIDQSAVFVADLTLLPLGVDGDRFTCNPNVLVEYGYALARLKESRVIPVINRTFGPVEELPFDLRHKALRVSYTLAEEATKDEIESAKRGLTGLFRSELRLILDDPRSSLSLSETEVRVARHLLGQSPDGRRRDSVPQEDIAAAIGLDISEVHRAVAELTSRGYVERLGVLGTDSPPVRASKSLFWDMDPYVQGWDPRADARTLAEYLVSASETGHGRLSTRKFAEENSWPLRRLNPALHFLVESGIVNESRTIVPDLVTLEILESEATRSFLRGRYDPDQRRRGG